MLLDDGALQPCSDCQPALQFGFSVYTTFCLPIDPFWLDAHLERLQLDAETLRIPWHPNRTSLLSALRIVLRDGATVVRVTVFPRLGQYADLFRPQAGHAQVMISMRPFPEAPAGFIDLKKVEYQRPLAHIKHGSMLESVHLKQVAIQGGYNDVLFVNRQGHLAESSTANVFLIRQGGLLTPEPGRDACLPGITRRRILQWAQRRGVPVVTDAVSPAHLNDCEGVFLSNAVSGVLPVARVDEQVIAWSAESRALLAEIQAELLPSPASLRGIP